MQASASSVKVAAPTSIHWNYLLPILSVHLLALLVLVPWLFSWSGVVLMLLGVHAFGTLGINLCYHRLLTHRSLKTPKWFERSLTTLAICSLQDTPIRWVATHRLHHQHSDDAEDPHSPDHGVLWSHMGWLFRPNPALRTLNFYYKYARDIASDPYYLYLEKHPFSPVWIYALHAALFYLAGLVVGRCWSGDWNAGVQLGASWLVWGAIARTVLVWHITWSVNSLTHVFGYRTYTTDENSRNNWFVALIAGGEGWHNNHHHDPTSASNQHRWWEFDLTYYTIVALKSVGLATDVIRPRRTLTPARGISEVQSNPQR